MASALPGPRPDDYDTGNAFQFVAVVIDTTETNTRNMFYVSARVKVLKVLLFCGVTLCI
jgi:hypothetical protein